LQPTGPAETVTNILNQGAALTQNSYDGYVLITCKCVVGEACTLNSRELALCSRTGFQAQWRGNCVDPYYGGVAIQTYAVWSQGIDNDGKNTWVVRFSNSTPTRYYIGVTDCGAYDNTGTFLYTFQPISWGSTSSSSSSSISSILAHIFACEMPANSEKEHLSIVICGHVDSGKSTTTGRLIFELGGLPERELEKLKAEAERLGKGSFAFAFYMDRQKEERERGVTIACTTKEFYTEKWHYTIIDAPGHRDFIKNMITGASQADVALIMVPADGNFTTAIAKGNHKAGEIQGQTRQHSRLINLLGVKQITIGVNKMDCDTAAYKQTRYDEIANEMKSMLIKVGWKKDTVEKNTPVLPISGWMGDNLLKKSENMVWWKGMDVECGTETIHCDTVYDVLDKLCRVPERPVSAPMRMPISGIYKIKGVGDVLAGRVEQGQVKPGEEVVFLPTHTVSNPCTGKVFTVEMHHQRVDYANPGDNVGLNIKGLDKQNMPRSGDVMVYKKDTTLGQTREFDAQIQVLDIPNEIKVGYSPIGFVRCGRSACRISALKWKMGKETGGKKMEDPHSLKSNEMAQCSFQPQQPLVCDTFKNCEGLSRVAFMDGNGVVMLGKVISCERKEEGSGGGKKK